MDPWFTIIGLGAIFIVLMIGAGVLKSVLSRGLDKVVDAGIKTVTAKKRAEIDQIVAVPLVMTSPQSREVVVSALDAILNPKKDIPILGVALFETERTADKITYAMGNKMYPQQLVFEVRFGERDGRTQVVFKCLNLAERNGLRPFSDALVRLRESVEYAVANAGDAEKVADGVKRYGPPEAGSPAALQLRNSKVLTWVGLAIIVVVLSNFKQGVYVSQLPLWLFGLVVGGGCMFLAVKLADVKGVRRTVAESDPDEVAAAEAVALPATDADGAPASASASTDSFAAEAGTSSPGVEHALAAADGVVKAATSRGKSAVGWFSALSGNAKAGVIAVAIVLVFAAGFLVSKAMIGSSGDGSYSDAYNVDNPGGTGGDYTPADTSSSDSAAGQDGASAADSSGQSAVPTPADQPEVLPLSQRENLQALLGTAGEGGAASDFYVWWDNGISASSGQLCFTGDGGDFVHAFAIGRNDPAEFYVDDQQTSADEFFTAITGSERKYGSISYTVDGVVSVHVQTVYQGGDT